MNAIDNRIDAYISRSEPFAQPILLHLRELIHTACPESIETIKWGFPHFEYKGSILCSMASFKKHCAFGFWLSSRMDDPYNLLALGDVKTAMGNLGKLTQVEDLPKDEILIAYTQQAKSLIDQGVKLSKYKPTTLPKTLIIPDYFEDALLKNPEAKLVFENFSTTNKKEYVEWVTESKTSETRSKRLQTALEWIAEGKIRHWKYHKK